MIVTKLTIFKVAKALSFFTFGSALIGLFVFGNYLMIQEHRPYHEILSSGFVYPIPGKGGNIYVSKSDLIIQLVLVAIAAIGAAGTHWFDKVAK